MKKCFITLLLLFALCVNVMAAPALVDNAGVLTDEEFASLTAELESIREDYGVDVAVYIDSLETELSAGEIGREIYDADGYGMGDDQSGMLLYLNLWTNNFWEVVNGSAQDVFDETAIEYLDDRFLDYAQYGEYADAVGAFAEAARQILDPDSAAEIAESSAFSQSALVDNANLLDDESFAAISARLDEIRNKYDMDVAIYTENAPMTYSTMETADDIYDYNGYGYGADYDGILLYFNTYSRDYWITTAGAGISAFDDEKIEFVEEKFLPYARDNDFANAFYAFANAAEAVLKYWDDNGRPAYYEESSTYWDDNGRPAYYEESSTRASTGHDPMHYLIAALILILLPLIVAAISTGAKTSKMKTANLKSAAGDYMKQGSMKLDRSQDIFLYSHTSRVRRENNSRSGSSTHTSSSGRSHGGGGGKF